MLIAEQVSVRLRQRQILEDAFLTARPGEVTAIIGPNGSGKTTFLRALSGDVSYTGKISINGLDVHQTTSSDLSVHRAVLPQMSELMFPFKVGEVVMLGARAGPEARKGKAHTQFLAKQALAKVGLEGYEGRFYQNLSGGEQQRVQLARVLCQVWEPTFEEIPRYLFLDEPISSLDIKHQLAVMELAGNFAKDGGGVLAILHDLNLTAMFADHVVLMSQGNIFACGKPQEVLTDENISSVYQCELRVNTAPDTGNVFVLPQSALPLVEAI